MPATRSEALRAAITFLVGLAAIIAVAAALSAARAEWKPEHGAESAETQAWYRRQQTTPETRQRLGAAWYQYCCDHADTVRAKFSKEGSGWMYMLEGESQWRAIPQDVVQPYVQTPRGRAVLFVDATYRHFGPVCFMPGAAGT